MSALIATFSELKYPKGVRRWSPAFLRRNRFKVAAAGFALLGFVTAGLTVLDDHSKAAEAQNHLRYEYDQLKGLMLAGKSVSPAVEIAIQQSAPLDLRKQGYDEQPWIDSGRPTEVPTPFGFVPSSARGDLFALATPDLRMALGEIDINLDEEFQVHFYVESDGSAVSDITPLTQSGLRTLVKKDGDRSTLAIFFTLKVDNELDALRLFDSFVKEYDRNDALLVVTVFTGACSAIGHSRLARVSVALGDQIAVVALLQEDTPTCEPDGTTNYRWRFRKPPELVARDLRQN
jgi:hypothetical protein